MRMCAMLALTLLFITIGCTLQPEKENTVTHDAVEPLLTEQGWAAGNNTALSTFLREYSGGGVAVFDWDNTVIKNDIGDALFFHMVETGQFPAPEDFADVSPFFTDDAVMALNETCLDAVENNLIRSDTHTACAKELLSIYDTARTTAGTSAFSGFDPQLTEPSYALLAHMLGGLEETAVRRISTDLFSKLRKAPMGSTHSVAGFTVPGYIRIYPQMRELVQSLSDNGFDVWIVSASPRPVVSACAEHAGVPADHVIGITSVMKNGMLTGDIRGCGSIADGENTMITYKKGKRCWINTEIFGRKNPLEKQPRKYRPVFGAGDSGTDLTFMHDVTGLRLLIDRGKPEITAAARKNSDGKWLIQPMFIQ